MLGLLLHVVAQPDLADSILDGSSSAPAARRPNRYAALAAAAPAPEPYRSASHRRLNYTPNLRYG